MYLTDTDGLLHSTTGPAIEHDDECGWYIHGKPYTNYNDFQKDTNLTDDQITILKLKYGNSFYFTAEHRYSYAPYIPIILTQRTYTYIPPPVWKVTLWTYVKLLYRKYMK
jgi:hypothetical protein